MLLMKDSMLCLKEKKHPNLGLPTFNLSLSIKTLLTIIFDDFSK